MADEILVPVWNSLAEYDDETYFARVIKPPQMRLRLDKNRKEVWRQFREGILPCKSMNKSTCGTFPECCDCVKFHKKQ